MHCKLCVDVHMCARARTHTHTMLRCIHAYMHTVKGKQTRGDKGEGGKGFGQEGGQGGREVNSVMDISKSASVTQKPNAASALAQNRQNPPVFDDEFFRNQLLQRSQARLGLRTGSISISISLSIYLSVCLSICLSIYLPTYLSIYLSICIHAYNAQTFRDATKRETERGCVRALSHCT